MVPIRVRNSQINKVRALRWAGLRDQTRAAMATLPSKEAA